MDLRLWRKSHKLTLEQLSEKLGIALTTLSDLERGVMPTISHELVARIHALTGGEVPFSDLHLAWAVENPSAAAQATAAGKAYRRTIHKPCSR